MNDGGSGRMPRRGRRHLPGRLEEEVHVVVSRAGDLIGAKAMTKRTGDAVSDRGQILLRLEGVYRGHGRRVYTLCLRLLADETAAEDATAQAFAQFGREGNWGRGGGRVLTRLRELAVRAALDHLPGTGGRVNPAASPSHLPPAEGSAGAHHAPPEAPTLDALVARLPQTLRVVFVLRDVEGLGEADIAAQLGLGKKEVRRLVGDARLHLLRLRREVGAGLTSGQ